jgi:ribosomal protein L31E
MASKLLTIGIRRYLVTQPRNKRARKAARYIRERISHYMKMDLDKVKFSKELNNLITSQARRMKPVKLNIEIDKGIATAMLFKEQAAQQKAPAAEQKHAAKAEGKEAAKKGGAQAAKEKAAPERAQKNPENAAQPSGAAHVHTEKSPENGSENATHAGKSQK